MSSGGKQVPIAGLTARLIAMAVMFLLAYDFPTGWFEFDAGQLAGEKPPEGYVPAMIVIAFGFGIVSMVNSVETLFRQVSMEPLLLVFTVLLVVSALWSEFPLITLRIAVPMLLIVFIGYWMAAQFRLEELLFLLCIVLAIGTLLNLFFVFALPVYGQSRLGWSGISFGKNAMGRLSVFAAMHFVLAAGVFPRARTIWMTFAALASVLVVGSESATSLAGLLFVFGMLVVFRLFRARRTLYGAITLALLGGGALSIFVATANLALVADILGKDVTLTGRTLLWQTAIQEGFNRPLLGHGWAGFFQGPLSPARPVLDVNTWNPPNAHNALLDYFLTVGLVGASIAMAMFLRLAVRSARAVRFRPGSLGLWPMSYTAFAFIFSITEFGVISRNLFFLFLVIHVTVAGAESKKRRKAPRPIGPQMISLRGVSS